MENAPKKRGSCENCSRAIGLLEKEHDWEGHIVCRECLQRLEVKTPPPAPAVGHLEASGHAELNMERPDADSFPPAGVSAIQPSEPVVWKGKPSQIVNIKDFAICALLCIGIWWAALAIRGKWPEGGTLRDVTLLIMFATSGVLIIRGLWKWLRIENVQFELTSQRFRCTTGVLSRVTDELELYRVKDTVLQQPVFLRIFGLGNIQLVTSDKTSPITLIRAVREPRALREKVRKLVEERRDTKRVREVDFE
jgi:membrane protein YdbS with pleckstrin-like domain